jgi:hypothetical protein
MAITLRHVAETLRRMAITLRRVAITLRRVAITLRRMAENLRREALPCRQAAESIHPRVQTIRRITVVPGFYIRIKHTAIFTLHNYAVICKTAKQIMAYCFCLCFHKTKEQG